MYVALAIGIPVFLLLGGALLGLAFHGAAEKSAGLTIHVPNRRQAPESQEPYLFMPGLVTAQKASLDELVAELEDHLSREMASAERFAANPTTVTLTEKHLN